jgi:two-component system, NarL family, nitrate/nitrite response regulator NarL
MLRAPVIVVHPSRLFSEGLAKICEGGLFQLTYVGTSIDSVPVDGDNPDCAPVFIVGGKSLARTVENIRTIRSHHKSSVIVVVGESSEASDVTPALDAGANCYLRETINAELLLKTLDLFTNDEIVLLAHSSVSEPAPGNGLTEEGTPHRADLQPELAASNGVTSPLEALSEPQGTPVSAPKLSSREAAILSGLVEGHPNKVIANRLNITEATVKVHVKAILRKIRAKNRTQAAIWAVKHNLASARGSKSIYS